MVVSVDSRFFEEFARRLEQARADSTDEGCRETLEWVAGEFEGATWIGLDTDTILDRCSTNRCGSVHIQGR